MAIQLADVKNIEELDEWNLRELIGTLHAYAEKIIALEDRVTELEGNADTTGPAYLDRPPERI